MALELIAFVFNLLLVGFVVLKAVFTIFLTYPLNMFLLIAVLGYIVDYLISRR